MTFDRRRLPGLIRGFTTLLFATSAHAAVITEVHYTMGTYFTMTVDAVEDSSARRVMRSCFADARHVETVFSRFDPASELNRVNADPAQTIALGADMADLLGRALSLHDATHGAFDVAIGDVTAFWRESATWPAVVSRNTTRERIRLRGHTLVKVDPSARLDFDGIAKGYAVDRCVVLLRRAGVTRALVSLGESSQYALGAPEGETGWSIALRGDDPTATVGTIRLRDQALSASAVFGHSRTLAGQRIGHIIDPETGAPLHASALAVVVADNATDAEAFSKAALIWGARGNRVGALHGPSPSRRIQAVVYVEDGRVSRWRSDAIHFVPARRFLRPGEEPLS